MRKAKSEWLLVLEPGARLLDGWADYVADHTGREAMAARFSRAKSARAPFLSRVFSHKRALADGLIITKRQATSLARNAHDAEGLARGLAMKRLAAQIVVAPPR